MTLWIFSAWEICNMKWGCAKKVIIKSQGQFMYVSNFYESDVILKSVLNYCAAFWIHRPSVLGAIDAHLCKYILIKKYKCALTVIRTLATFKQTSQRKNVIVTTGQFVSVSFLFTTK